MYVHVRTYVYVCMCALTETLVCEAVSVCVETYEMHLCVNNVCCVYDSCVHVECVYPLRLLCTCISIIYLNCPSVKSFSFLIYSFLYSWEKCICGFLCSCVNNTCELLRSFSNKLHSCPNFFPLFRGGGNWYIDFFIHQIIPIFSFQIPTHSHWFLYSSNHSHIFIPYFHSKFQLIAIFEKKKKKWKKGRQF